GDLAWLALPEAACRLPAPVEVAAAPARRSMASVLSQPAARRATGVADRLINGRSGAAMNPRALEEAGKFANTVASALGSQPMTLAMIVTNIMLLIFLFYSQNQFYNQRQELSLQFLAAEKDVRTILSQCIVPGKQP